MFQRSRVRARLSAVVVIAAVPLTMAGFARVLPTDAGATSGASWRLASSIDLDPAALLPRDVAPQTTISAGLRLRTAAERNRRIAVTTAKGRRVWTASSLAEHDLPSAAMRAYKTAARTIDAQLPGCHLSWPLLAGIGRVESDHGRYGGSTLGADGVPRPAIVGIALNGVGPVAAIHDTDGGRFDGDRVWDRAVGPMQFIPSTWRSAGRDGDGDGVKNPNDIDDAALASAAYLCHGGRDLSRPADQRAAIYSYNASDYYVALVSAFARGYGTGSFAIPSPAVGPDAGDGVVHLRSDGSGAKAKKNKATKTKTEAAKGAEASTGHTSGTKHPAPKPAAATPSPKPTPTPSPSPVKPTPTPTPSPAVLTATGAVSKVAGGWRIDTVTLAPADLVDPAFAQRDWDGDGEVESTADELDGLVDNQAAVVLRYATTPTFDVVGFEVP